LPNKKRAKKDPEQARLEKVRVIWLTTPCPSLISLSKCRRQRLDPNKLLPRRRNATKRPLRRGRSWTRLRKRCVEQSSLPLRVSLMFTFIKERKEAEKAKQKDSKGLNKLVSSRNDTLKDMTIEFTPALRQNPSPLLNAIPKIKARILEESKEASATISWPIGTFHPEPPLANIPNLVRWKRRIVAKYNNDEKEWQAVDEPYERIEGSYLLYWTLRDLASQIQNPSTEQISKTLATLRAHLGLRYQVFLLIDHSGNQWSKLSQDVKNQVEARLVTLQVEHNCFVIRAQDSEDLVRRFFDLTADLGVKPHK